MNEYSRILIEQYCSTHNSKKSRRLSKLVEMSYELDCIPTDSDAVFLEKVIESENDPFLKEALLDLSDFLFI